MNLRGKHVVYTDSLGQQHDAIVTEDWSRETPVPSDNPEQAVCKAMNLAYVDLNEGSRDTYGQQIIRVTSVAHRSAMGGCHGNFWTLDNYSK